MEEFDFAAILPQSRDEVTRQSDIQRDRYQEKSAENTSNSMIRNEGEEHCDRKQDAKPSATSK
jgi:hypothetical protein